MIQTLLLTPRPCDPPTRAGDLLSRRPGVGMFEYVGRLSYFAQSVNCFRLLLDCILILPANKWTYVQHGFDRSPVSAGRARLRHRRGLIAPHLGAALRRVVLRSGEPAG